MDCRRRTDVRDSRSKLERCISMFDLLLSAKGTAKHFSPFYRLTNSEDPVVLGFSFATEPLLLIIP